MSAVQEPIEDGFGESGGAEIVVRVLDDFHEVVALGGAEFLDIPVVEDERFGLEQLFREAWIGAIAMGDAQLLEQPGDTEIANRLALAAGLVTECTRDPGLATSRGVYHRAR